MTREEKAREKLQAQLDACAKEISEHGANALWGDSKHVTKGSITIEINTMLTATVEYHRHVIPEQTVFI